MYCRAKESNSTMAHVGGRLKCLPEPNRNVWSGTLSRAQLGTGIRYVQSNFGVTVEQSRQSTVTLLRAQWGRVGQSTGAVSRAANTDSADSFASPSFPLFSASSSSYNMF